MFFHNMDAEFCPQSRPKEVWEKKKKKHFALGVKGVGFLSQWE